jgi:hypothetical protein
VSQLIVIGTKIEEFTGFCSANGQMTYEFKCRSAWSDVVCREMKWTEEPLGFGNGNLDGSLYGINMILEPNKAALKDYRFDLPISKVSKFKHVASIKDGKVSSRELEFVVTTVDETTPQVISLYISKCYPGDDRGQAKIVFNAEEQPKLGENGKPAEEKPRGRKRAAKAE